MLFLFTYSFINLNTSFFIIMNSNSTEVFFLFQLSHVFKKAGMSNFSFLDKPCWYSGNLNLLQCSTDCYLIYDSFRASPVYRGFYLAEAYMNKIYLHVHNQNICKQMVIFLSRRKPRGAAKISVWFILF